MLHMCRVTYMTSYTKRKRERRRRTGNERRKGKRKERRETRRGRERRRKEKRRWERRGKKLVKLPTHNHSCNYRVYGYDLPLLFPDGEVMLRVQLQQTTNSSNTLTPHYAKD